MNNSKIGRDADGGGTSAISVVLKTVNRPTVLPSEEDAGNCQLPLATPFGVRGIKDKQHQQLFCCNRYFSSLKNYQQHLAEKAVTDAGHEKILTEMGMAQCSICSVWVLKNGMSLHLRKFHGAVRVNKAARASPATVSSEISDKPISNATLKSGKSYVIKVSGQALSAGQSLMVSHSAGRSNNGETCATSVANASPPLKLITTSSGNLYPKIHLQQTTTGTAGKVIVRQNTPGSAVPVMSFGPRFIMKSNAAKTLGTKNGIPLSGTGIHKILPSNSSLLQSNSGVGISANGITTLQISGGSIVAGPSSGHPAKVKTLLNTKVDKHILKRDNKPITKEFVTLEKGSGFKLQRKREDPLAPMPASPAASFSSLLDLELEGKAKKKNVTSAEFVTGPVMNADVNARLSLERELLPDLKTKGANSGIKKMGVKGAGLAKNKNVLVLKLNNSQVMTEAQGCNSQIASKRKAGAKKKTETKRGRKKTKDGSPMGKVIDPPVTSDSKPDTRSEELCSDDRRDILHRDSLEDLPGKRKDFLVETVSPKSALGKKRRKQVLKPVIEPEGDPNMATRLTSKVKVRKKGKTVSVPSELMTPKISKKNSSSPSVNHKKYCKRLKENKCDTYKPTPKTSRPSGRGGRGGWRKKRPVGRPRREQVAEPATPDLSELDSLFDHLDNEDVENEPLVPTKTEDDENVPTVELDMFTLPSLNEQMSVLLTDPHNPDFKVYASMDAIFVGDSALGDVTNQIGYVTDANNVVFVNPGHFLFPNIQELDKFVPSPILTVKEKMHMSPKKMGKINSGSRHSSVVCKENHFVKKSSKGNFQLQESLGSDSRKQTKTVVVGQKKTSTVNIGVSSLGGVKKLSKAKVVSELSSSVGKESTVVKVERVTNVVGVPGSLDSSKEVRVRRRSMRLSGEKSDGEQAPLMLVKDEELGFKKDDKTLEPKSKKTLVDVKATGSAVRKGKTEVNTQGTRVNTTECSKELKVLISPIKLEYQSLVENLKEEQKKISLRHRVALTFDNHDDKRMGQMDVNLRKNGVPLEPSGSSVKSDVEENAISPRRLRTRTRSADSANSYVKPLRIEPSSSGLCNSTLNNYVSKRKGRLKSESDVSRARDNINISGISVSTCNKTTHASQLGIEVEKNSVRRPSCSMSKDSSYDSQHQRTREGKWVESSLSRSDDQSLARSEPAKPVVKTLVENSVIQGKNSAITNNGALSLLRSRPIRERRPSSKWLESLALERRSRKVSSPKLRTERSASDTTNQSSFGKQGLLSDCDNQNSVMLNVKQLQNKAKVLSDNCRSGVKNEVGIVKVNVDEIKKDVSEEIQVKNYMNEEIDMEVNDVKTISYEEETSRDNVNRGGGTWDGQLSSANAEGNSSEKGGNSREKEYEKSLENEKESLVGESSIGGKIYDSVQSVQNTEVQPGHLDACIDRNLSCKDNETRVVLPPCVWESEGVSCLEEKYNLDKEKDASVENRINVCRSEVFDNDGSAAAEIGGKVCTEEMQEQVESLGDAEKDTGATGDGIKACESEVFNNDGSATVETCGKANTGELQEQVEKVGDAEKDTGGTREKWEERRILKLPLRKNGRGRLKKVDNINSVSSNKVDNLAVVVEGFCETDVPGASNNKVNHSEAINGGSNDKVMRNAGQQKKVLTSGEVANDDVAPGGGDDSYAEEEERGKSQEKDGEINENLEEDGVMNRVENVGLNTKGNVETRNDIAHLIDDVSLTAEVVKGTGSVEQQNLDKTSAGMNSINVSFEESKFSEGALECTEKSKKNNQKKETFIESKGWSSNFDVADATDSVEKKDDVRNLSGAAECQEAGVVSLEKSSMELTEFERKEVQKEILDVDVGHEENVENETANLANEGSIGNETASCLADVEVANVMNKVNESASCLANVEVAYEENIETESDLTGCGAYQEVKVGSDTSQWPEEIRESASSIGREDDTPSKKSRPVKKVPYSKKKGRRGRKKMTVEIVALRKDLEEGEVNTDISDDGGSVIGAESEDRVGEAGTHVCESEVMRVDDYKKREDNSNDNQSMKIADSKVTEGDEETELGRTVCEAEIISNATETENDDSEMTEFGNTSNQIKIDIDPESDRTSVLGEGMKAEGSSVETQLLQESVINEFIEMEEAKCDRMEEGEFDNDEGKAVELVSEESETKRISSEIKDNVSEAFETTTGVGHVEQILEGEITSESIGDKTSEAPESKTTAENTEKRSAWHIANRVEEEPSKTEGEFKSPAKSRGKSSSPKSTGSPSPSKVALDWSPSREWLGRGAKLKAQVLIQDQQTGVTDSHVFSSHGFPEFKKTLVSPEKPDPSVKGDKERVLGAFSTSPKASGGGQGAASPMASGEAQGAISPKVTRGSQETTSPRASGRSQGSAMKVPRCSKLPRASCEDREWQARGAKLKAKIMISDQQSGQINTRVDVTDNLYLPPLKSPPLKRSKLETSPSMNMKDIRSFFTYQKSPEPLAKVTTCEVMPKSCSSSTTNCQSTEGGNSPSPLISDTVMASPLSADCVGKVSSPVDADSPCNPSPLSADCVKVGIPVGADSPCNPSPSIADCVGKVSSPVSGGSPCNPSPSIPDCVGKVSSPVGADSSCSPSPLSTDCVGKVNSSVGADSPYSPRPSIADCIGKVSSHASADSPCNPSPSSADCSKALPLGTESSSECGPEGSNSASKLSPLSTSSSSILLSSQSAKSSVNNPSFQSPSFFSSKVSHQSGASPANKSSPQSGRRRKLRLYSVTSSDIRTFFSPLPGAKRKRELSPSLSPDGCKTLKTELKEEDSSSLKSPKIEDIPDVCPLQITRQYHKERLLQNYPTSADSVVPKDFEGFCYRSRQSGLRAKALVRVVSLIEKRHWHGVELFPLPVDQLCDWDDDMLDDRIFDKFS